MAFCDYIGGRNAKLQFKKAVLGEAHGRPGPCSLGIVVF